MNTLENYPTDTTTSGQNFLAALSGFGFACVTFFFTCLVLLPLTHKLAILLAIPDALTATLVFIELFGFTAAMGIYGVVVASREMEAQK